MKHSVAAISVAAAQHAAVTDQELMDKLKDAAPAGNALRTFDATRQVTVAWAGCAPPLYQISAAQPSVRGSLRLVWFVPGGRLGVTARNIERRFKRNVQA
jgi:hypothetical protein